MKEKLELFKKSLEGLSITELNTLLNNLQEKWKKLDWKPTRGGHHLSDKEKEEKDMLTQKINLVSNKISAIKLRS